MPGFYSDSAGFSDLGATRCVLRGTRSFQQHFLRPSNFVARPPSLLTHPVASFSYRALLVSDYSKGFGGKYGIDKDKVDKSAVGFEYQGKTEKHESQKGTCRFLPLARPSQGDRRGHRRREEWLSPAVV